MDQITVMIYFVGQRDWGKGASCGNVPVKNKGNRFLFLKENYIYIYIYISMLFHRLGVALLSSPKKV